MHETDEVVAEVRRKAQKNVENLPPHIQSKVLKGFAKAHRANGQARSAEAVEALLREMFSN